MRLWERLARPAPQGGYLPELDALRALAIGLVFWLHLNTTLLRSHPSSGGRTFAAGGGWGVALFFTISGFVLALPFARHYLRGEPMPSLRAYYLRRVRRIEPPYLLALAVAFFAQVTTHRATAAELLPHLAASATYVHNVVYGTWSSVLPVAWSLEIEIQFYLIAPVLFRLFSIASPSRRPAALWLVTAAAFGLSSLAHPWLAANRLDRSLLSDGGFFLLGLALAERFVSVGAPEKSGAWDLFAGVAIPTALWFWPTGETFSQAIGALAVIAVFGAAFGGMIARRFALWPPAAVLGGMCYSLYLTHYPILFGVVPRFTSSFLGGAAGLSIAAVAGAVFYLVAERPFLSRQKNVKVL